MSAEIRPAITANPDDIRLARATGLVLRGGVIISGALVLFGLILFLTGHDAGAPQTLDEATGKTGATYDVSLRSIIDNIADGSAMGFIELGLLALILTPTVRVAITAIYLNKNHERVLVGMALFVLVILVLGLVGIGA
jgi:uncharacterized membrane protein